MKTFRLLLGLSISFLIANSALAQLESEEDFFLAENGVTIMCPNAAVGDSGEIDGTTYTKRTRDQITVENASTTCTSGITDMYNMFRNAYSFNQNIGHWDVSSVTNMQFMFYSASNFNQPIGDWDVSSVTNMKFMFSRASAFNQPIGEWDVSSVNFMDKMFDWANSFNQPIGDWNVSNVYIMEGMFNHVTEFNQPIGNWDVSNVIKMNQMFANAEAFDQPIENWDVSNVTDISSMFFKASSFNQNISNWDVSSVTKMHGTFSGAKSFNQPIENWNVGNVSTMLYMFGGTPFNQPIGNWDVSSVTNMEAMFEDASNFDQPIGDWDVSSVTNMRSMFTDASNFNQDLNNWNVSSVTDMDFMFFRASMFNQPIGSWNVGNVSTMEYMFGRTPFNQPIGNWDVSSVTNMRYMFFTTDSFNQDIGSWNVSSVLSMFEMFSGASSFNQNIGDWNLSQVTDIQGMLFESGLSVQNYDQTLMGWANYSNTAMDLVLHASGLVYCNAVEARSFLIDELDWNIIGDEECARPVAVTFSPEEGGENVTPDSLITVEFNEGIIEEDLSGITIASSDGTQLGGVAATIEEKMLTISHDGFGFEETYTVTIPAGAIRNDQGTENAEISWSFSTVVATSIDDLEVVADFSLSQNYPNPFNPTTQINFGLPEASAVTLEVYNTLGQRVAAVLLNEQRTAGSHTVSFDASNLSSGLYIYRIVAENYMATKKMVLVK